MIAAIPAILQYGIPLVTSLVGYIAGRIHQHMLNRKKPKAPPIPTKEKA